MNTYDWSLHRPQYSALILSIRKLDTLIIIEIIKLIEEKRKKKRAHKFFQLRKKYDAMKNVMMFTLFFVCLN